MKIIAGLGNPGNQYQNTRHNVGFIILEAYADKNNLIWEHNSKLNAFTVRHNDVLMLKPQTFMNNSGTCINKVLNYFNTTPTQLLIIHDEVDLEFGKTKLQCGASAAGHHGVLNIIEKIGTKDFNRLRVGVGRPKEKEFDVMDWVLTKFSNEELEYIKSIPIPFEF